MVGQEAYRLDAALAPVRDPNTRPGPVDDQPVIRALLSHWDDHHVGIQQLQ